jgi:hypothetical protein
MSIHSFEPLERREMLSVSPAVVNPAKIKVKNLFDADGASLNQSLISIPFSVGIRLADASKIAVRGYAVNPLTGAQVKLSIATSDIHVDPTATNYLIIQTDVLMRKNGGKILINDGALTDTKGRTVSAMNLSSPKGQNKERFTLANRAFVPTRDNLFSKDIFADASNPVDASTHVSATTVATNFKAFMDEKVADGLITQDTETKAIKQFNNTTVKAIIPDANLRAAMLSLYGTIGEPAISSMLDGTNVTGKPQTIIDFSTDVSASADVAETLVLVNGRLRTLFKTSYAGEPFEALSAKIAHEAIHQDKDDNLNEEVVANTIETMVYAQQLLVDSSYVSAGTTLIKADNDKLLAMLDSGKALFPRIGILAGSMKDTTGGVFKGSSIAGGAYMSFDDYIRRTYTARGFGEFNSNGNPTLDAIVKNATLLSKMNTFNSTLISDIDANQQIITDKNSLVLAGILKLTIA